MTEPATSTFSITSIFYLKSSTSIKFNSANSDEFNPENG